MTESEKHSDLETKLQLFTELFNDLKTEAPGVLKKFLEDYKYLFDDEGNDKDMVESSKCVDASCQTEDENQWNLANIIEDVTEIAEKATLETGFNYDAKSGWYFDTNMNCYYNPDYRLYYYKDRNAYYYYDQESNELKFYYSLASESDSFNAESSNLMEISNHSNDDDQDPQPSGINKKPDDGFDPSSECNEEGECSESEENAQSKSQTISETPLNPLTPVVIEAGPTVFEPDNTKHFAPCIRIVVMSSTLPELSYGTLFIVTCTGGTIGREGNHDVLIPDPLVSKMHGKFQYVLKDGSYVYELIDLGSKNGTFVNGIRLSESLVQSGPATISHGSVIVVGFTNLLCHIHPNDETCPLCSVVSSVNKGHDTGSETEETLNEKRHKQALTIKKKFGIHSSSSKLPEGYEDRSEVRRKQVGSSHSSEKTETASVNEPICKRNKGYNLLSKMGWKEGETLGKNNEGGTLEPILPAERINPTSGLGCDVFHSLNGKSRKSDIAMKTFERYKMI